MGFSILPHLFGTLRNLPFSLLTIKVVAVQIAVIEHLPAELRDRFTEMRTSDLEVQSESGRASRKEPNIC